MIQPLWQLRHNGLSTFFAKPNPAANLRQRAPTAKAKTCLAIDGADLDARRFYRCLACYFARFLSHVIIHMPLIAEKAKS